MEGSKPGTLNKADWKSIAWGAGEVVLAALLTYLGDNLGNMDFGAQTPTIVALLAIGIRTARKLVQG